MEDPYLKLYESLHKVIVKLADMICELAKRSLTAKEYLDFVKMFEEKPKPDIKMPDDRKQ